LSGLLADEAEAPMHTATSAATITAERARASAAHTSIETPFPYCKDDGLRIERAR
jgi:hypothetical protein